MAVSSFARPPDVAAKKYGTDYLARQHAMRSAAFIEDGIATGAWNSGLLGLGHTSCLQLSVVVAHDTMTETRYWHP